MWCCCCKYTNDAMADWDEEIESIIHAAIQLRQLSKKCILQRELGRRHPWDDDEVVRCFGELDTSLLNCKLMALHFLAPDNVDLLRRGSDRVKSCRQLLENRMNMLAELNPTKKDEGAQLEAQNKPRSIADDESKLAAIFARQTRLLREIKQCLLRSDEELEHLEAEIEALANEAGGSDDEEGREELDEEIRICEEKVSVQYTRQRLGRRPYDNSADSLQSFTEELLKVTLPLAEGCFGWLRDLWCDDSGSRPRRGARRRSRSAPRRNQNPNTSSSSKTRRATESVLFRKGRSFKGAKASDTEKGAKTKNKRKKKQALDS